MRLMPSALARLRTPSPTAVPKARFSQSRPMRKSSTFLPKRPASSLLGEVHGCRPVAAGRRADLEHVFIAPLGDDIGGGDSLPVDDAAALGFRADRNAERRSVSPGDQLDAA